MFQRMTKETVLKCLLDDYPKGRNFEPFFRKVIDDFAGDSKVVDNYCFEQIRLYINSLT